MTSLDFLVTVEATEPSALEFEVQVENAALGEAEQDFEVTVDSSLIDAARPRDTSAPGVGLCQMIGWEIRLDGELAASSTSRNGWAVSDFYVESTMEGTTAGVRIAAADSCDIDDDGQVRLSRVANPWGSPYQLMGPTGGKGEIDIDGIYATENGLQYIPLMRRGIVDNSRRDVDGVAGDSLNIIDAYGRHDHAPLFLVFPPGHNLTRRTMVIWISQEAFVPTHVLSGGTRTKKEVRASTQDWWEVCRQLMEVEGRALHFDHTGALNNPLLLPKGAPLLDPPVMTFDERDIIEGTFTSEHSSEVPTRVCVWGSEQLECFSSETRITVRETFGKRQVSRARFQYDIATENYTPVVGGGDLGEAEEVIEKVTTVVELSCDTVLSETTWVERWYNPQAARHYIGTKPFLPASRVYIYETGAPNPPLSASAFKWSEERFVTVSHVKVTNIFDPATGEKIGEDETRSGWYNAECAIKQRSNSAQDWEGQPIEFRYTEASGRPVDLLAEVYVGLDGKGSQRLSPWASGTARAFLERSRTESTVSNGYITTSTKIVDGLRAEPGVVWLYNGGQERASECERWGQKERRVELFEPIKEDSHRRTETLYDELDQLVDHVTELQIGFQPIAEQFLSLVPPNNFYDRDPSQAANAIAASRGRQQPLLAIANAPALEVGHAESELRIRDEWANDITELNQLAADALRIAASQPVEITVPGNFLVRRGTKIHITMPSASFNHDVWVVGVKHEQSSPGDSITTRISTRFFPI